jgi:hypothetical protein
MEVSPVGAYAGGITRGTPMLINDGLRSTISTRATDFEGIRTPGS